MLHYTVCSLRKGTVQNAPYLNQLENAKHVTYNDRSLYFFFPEYAANSKKYPKNIKRI